MTYIEYALYDLDTTEQDIKQNVEIASKIGVNCISVPYSFIKLVKGLVADKNIIVSTAIDYPLGILDSGTRNTAIKTAINNGAEKIEIVLQNNYLTTRKYDKIRHDIKSNTDITNEYKIPLFYHLEYRVFTHQSLIKSCEILQEFGIHNVYPSTGYMLDDIEDNMIASIILKTKTNINTIISGNIWTKSHFECFMKHKFSSIRINNINSLMNFKKFILNTNK